VRLPHTVNEFHIEWWKALGAGLVFGLVTWAFQRLLPTRKAVPFVMGAVIGGGILVLGSYLSWRLNHR